MYKFIKKTTQYMSAFIVTASFLTVIFGTTSIFADCLNGDGANCNPPSLTLSASPTTVSVNSTTKLTWTSSNVSNCTASGAWSGSKSVNTTASETKTMGSVGYFTFTLSCTGTNGTVITKSVAVTVISGGDGVIPNPTNPSLSLSASPTTVSVNSTTKLTWTSSNVSNCTASGAWSGSKSVNTTASETKAMGSVGSFTYTLSCTGTNGTVVKQSATVTVLSGGVTPIPDPTLEFTVSPVNVAYNQQATLTWKTTNTKSCTASVDWSGSKSATGGSENVTPIYRQTAYNRYVLTCTGNNGIVLTKEVVAYASAPPAGPIPAPELTFNATQTSIPYSGTTMLQWESKYATSCTASGDWSGSKALTGSQQLSNMTLTRTYKLSCTNTSGTVNGSVTITVGPPAPRLTTYYAGTDKLHTVPVGVKYIEIVGVGGGGGGASGTSLGQDGCSGTGSSLKGYSTTLSGSGSTQISVTVGAGGAGGPANAESSGLPGWHTYAGISGTGAWQVESLAGRGGAGTVWRPVPSDDCPVRGQIVSASPSFWSSPRGRSYSVYATSVPPATAVNPDPNKIYSYGAGSGGKGGSMGIFGFVGAGTNGGNGIVWIYEA